MINKNTKLIGLNELEITNDDLFVRKSITGLSIDSKVIVDETHVAILLKNGIALETLRPGIYPIFTKKSMFSKNEKIEERVELFYISKTAKLNILWGTPSLFDVHDPISDVPAKMGANGEIEIRIKNPRQFYLEVVGVSKKFSIDDLKERLKGRLLACIEPTINAHIQEHDIPLSRVSESKMQIANTLHKVLNRILNREYGLEVSSFIISNVNIADRYIDMANEESHEDEVVCKNCGAILPLGSKFCNNCGERV